MFPGDGSPARIPEWELEGGRRGVEDGPGYGVERREARTGGGPQATVGANRQESTDRFTLPWERLDRRLSASRSAGRGTRTPRPEADREPWPRAAWSAAQTV